MRSRLAAFMACVLLTAAGPLALAQQLDGTLFTSAEERAYLDYLREEFLTRSQEQGFDIEVPEIPTVPVQGEEAAAARPVEFTLGAIITRRDGARTVWINNQSMEESELPDFLAITETNGIAALQVTYEGRRFVVKPGQTVNVTTGEVLEAYQRPPAEIVPETTTTVEPAGTEEMTASGQAEATDIRLPEPAAAVPTTAASTDVETTRVEQPVGATEEIQNVNPAILLNALAEEAKQDPALLDEMVDALLEMRDNLDEDP